MTTTKVVTPTFRRYGLPGTVVGRFVFRRHMKSFIFGGLIFASYVISKASSYISIYPTQADRVKIAGTLGGNVGIEAILGQAHNLVSIGGYMAWNFLCLLAAVGAVWGFLTAIRALRGEEDMGRWELMLIGQTTPRKATANVLASLYGGLIIVYAFLLLALGVIGRTNGADLTTSSSLFFALTLLCGAIEFLAVGALMSQLIPSRGRAAGYSAIIFGVFYGIRVVADTTSAHWLLYLSPLGWIEKLQPMYASQPLWLLPIFGFAIVLCTTAVFLAGRRDLYDAIFADKSTARARLNMLKTPLSFAMRLTRPATIGWLLAVGAVGFVYSLFAKAASQVFSQSASFERTLSKIAQTAQHEVTLAYIGIIFLLAMIVLLVYAASAVGRVRNDEALSYLDNLLVQPVSRMRWFWGRVILVIGTIVVAGLISGFAAWLGMLNEHLGISLQTLLGAGLNIAAPAILVTGIGFCAFGITPRLTSFVVYGSFGWSFLLLMLGDGLKLNHWLLDTSILYHVPLAPAVNENWTTSAIMICIGLVLCLIGDLTFDRRDLQNE
ncbi:MAG TPA: hypothetical protein VGS28_00960 [Candidatus Saccharimonadales bacterium]|nr:hypothetical protein [Candidatus Saccharimonadales bacterium]